MKNCVAEKAKARAWPCLASFNAVLYSLVKEGCSGFDDMARRTDKPTEKVFGHLAFEGQHLLRPLHDHEGSSCLASGLNSKA